LTPIHAVLQAQETYEVDLHEAAMKIAQMEGELDTSALHVSRVDAEKLALEAKLIRAQDDGKKVQRELEVSFDMPHFNPILTPF